MSLDLKTYWDPAKLVAEYADIKSYTDWEGLSNVEPYVDRVRNMLQGNLGDMIPQEVKEMIADICLHNIHEALENTDEEIVDNHLEEYIWATMNTAAGFFSTLWKKSEIDWGEL